jgi:predicted O-linked N-acetylglucosamine transferase (SPINDLY family)
LVTPLLVSVVEQYLGDQVTVFPHQDYVRYMDVIAGCHMFINPFPFGNTNGIIDTVSAGLVGVCKTGPEVHEHIDEGLFGRLGLPDWLVTHSVDDYVAAAVRLAENHAERRALAKAHTGAGKVDVLFEGRPEIMGQKMLVLCESRSNKYAV